MKQGKRKLSANWTYERDFSKYLCDNIQIIGNVMGKSLAKASTEVKYSSINGKGKYPADIVATTYEGNKIVIENQYGCSDHIHLGKLLCYSTWLGASTMVWIAEEFDKEHFNAINTLNKNSDFNCYMLIAKLNPKLELVEVREDDLIEPSETGEYKHDKQEELFWKKFGENYLPEIEKITYSPSTTKSDYSEIRFGSCSYFNLAIRQGFNQFKVELICSKSRKGDLLLYKINELDEYIQTYLIGHLEKCIEIKIHDRNITAIFEGDVYNTEKWDTYMKCIKDYVTCIYDLINTDIFKS